jgi:hypothetical protein
LFLICFDFGYENIALLIIGVEKGICSKEFDKVEIKLYLND